MGMRGPLPRDFFLTSGQRFIADFLGGIGSSPLTTAVSTVLNGITGGGEIPSPREFTRQVIEEMIRGGALQLFIGALTHGRGGGSARGGRRGGSATSETTTRTADVPEAAVRPVEAARSSVAEATTATTVEATPTPPPEPAPVVPAEPPALSQPRTRPAAAEETPTASRTLEQEIDEAFGRLERGETPQDDALPDEHAIDEALARAERGEISQDDALPDEHAIGEAFMGLERGEMPQRARLLDDLLIHSQRRQARAQLAQARGAPMPGRPGRTPEGVPVNPNPGFQSAHPTPQSIMRGLDAYDPSEAITRILPTGRGHAHTVFDQAWQRGFEQIRRETGRTRTTAGEMYEVLARAARQSGAFSPAEAESMVAYIRDDIFVTHGLSETQDLPMPGVR
jgi:hypothetical protein